MTPLRRFFLPSRRVLKSVLLCLFFLLPLRAVTWATNAVAFTCENADLQTVIKKVGELTGTTFLFDPEQVKGKITLLSPKKLSSEETLKLLQSALALQGYTLLKKEAGTWVVPAEQVTQAETTIEVIPLKYARAAEVADTLSWIAPLGSGSPRIIPRIASSSQETRKQ